MYAALLGTLALCIGAYLGFRGAIACEAPGELWFWDLAWLASIAIQLAILVFLGRLVIALEADALVVRFGFLSLGEARFSLTQIERSSRVRYEPIRQFGGWGWRVGKHEGETTVVYSIRGSHGVLLRLRQPIRAFFRTADLVLVGSGRAAELAAALERLHA